MDRFRAPLRRGLEILATIRRGGSWARAVADAAPGAQVVHAKALIALPVARSAVRITAGRDGRFVYDVADLHTESARLVRLPGALRELVRRREGRLVREAAGVLAATPAMAAEVARRFRVVEPVVLLNCPPAWRPEIAGPDPIGSAGGSARARIGGPDRRPIVLYQGAFRVDQGIEELVAATDDPALVASGALVAFLGFGHLEGWLRAEAARRPDRLAVLPAVPEAELLDWTAGADVAFVGAPPRTLNQRLTLPNKLFQSLMAGVPIVVGTGPSTAGSRRPRPWAAAVTWTRRHRSRPPSPSCWRWIRPNVRRCGRGAGRSRSRSTAGRRPGVGSSSSIAALRTRRRERLGLRCRRSRRSHERRLRVRPASGGRRTPDRIAPQQRVRGGLALLEARPQPGRPGLDRHRGGADGRGAPGAGGA